MSRDDTHETLEGEEFLIRIPKEVEMPDLSDGYMTVENCPGSGSGGFVVEVLKVKGRTIHVRRVVWH